MEDDQDDFGPVLVTAAQVQSWLSRFGRGRTREVAPSPSPSPETTPKRTERAAPTGRRRALPPLRGHSVVATLVLALAVWAASGFYKVQPDQMGLVMHFGRWIDTRGPGLNYHLPYPIEVVLLPRVTAVNQLRIGNGAVMQMLTGDENIVEATASISWRIKDPAKFLFNVFDPEATVKVAGESAVRQIIGLNPIQSGLSDQRQKIADDAQALLQRILDSYDAGIQITQVQLQRVDPPLAVIDAFNDVQRARADQQRARNEAEAYRNDILPRARAEADRLQQEAQAYKEQVLNQAHSDADRFAAIDSAYSRSPDTTARRLYLDAMEDVLKSAGKILIDPSGRAGPSIIPFLSLPGQQSAAPPAAKVTP
jgi:membrane protease subunit HflK